MPAYLVRPDEPEATNYHQPASGLYARVIGDAARSGDVPPAERDLRAERRRRHCLAMAAATYDLADWTEDPEMIEAYVTVAATWLRKAHEIAPLSCADGVYFDLPQRD